MPITQFGEKRDRSSSRTRLDGKREDRLVGGSFRKKEHEEREGSAEIAMKLPAS